MLVRLLIYTLFSLALIGATACGPTAPPPDDDDSAGDDDDATGDDDDSAGDDDDDSAGDDDDDSAGDDDDDDSAGLACDDEALAAALATLGDWSRLNSCGGFFSASTADDDFRLALSFAGPEGSTDILGTLFEVDIGAHVPGDASTGYFEVQTGANLSQPDCNDALVPGQEPVIDAAWIGIEGTFLVEATTAGEEKWPGGPILFTGDVHLSGIVVAYSGGLEATCTIPDMTWTGRAFGWLPG